VASWIIGIPFFAATLEATSRPIDVAPAITTPEHCEEIALAHAPPSNVEKQSPTTETTFETPSMLAASSAPIPQGTTTVGAAPSELAAPTSCAVIGWIELPEVSAITVHSILSPPQITFASSRSLPTTVDTDSAPSNF